MQLPQQLANGSTKPGARPRWQKVRLIIVVGAAIFIGVTASVWSLLAVNSLPIQANLHSSVINQKTAFETQAIQQGSQARPAHYPVTIRKPVGPPRVLTGILDPYGDEVTVSCSTCHSTRQPNFANKAVAALNEFHSDLKFSHGSVSCLSCHNSTDYDALKLADGSRVEFVDVMTLCAQCHGPQMKDYEHGAHGGMNGFWDLKRGPRKKLNCVDCHQPHSPQFPKMHPTFKPKDRFLEPQGAQH